MKTKSVKVRKNLSKKKKIENKEKRKSKFKLNKSLKSPLSLFFRKKPKVDRINKKIVNAIKNRIKGSKKVYETDFDKLLDLIKIYKRLKISDVAKGFGISKEKAEEWGTILEEHDLLKLYYPTFGEAELREKGFVTKKIPVKKNRKKKVIISLIIVLLVVSATVFLILKDGKKIPLKIIKPNIISAAFSGSGSYECYMKKGDVMINYWIKDKKMRVATKTAGKTTISIFIESYMYTYLTTKDQWIKVEIPKATVVPGSGKIPKEKITCKRSTVDDAKFQIPEDKIRSV